MAASCYGTLETVGVIIIIIGSVNSYVGKCFSLLNKSNDLSILIVNTKS